MKVLQSVNKFRGFVAVVMRKKIINFVSQGEVHGGRKIREKVGIEIFEI